MAGGLKNSARPGPPSFKLGPARPASSLKEFRPGPQQENFFKYNFPEKKINHKNYRFMHFDSLFCIEICAYDMRHM